PVGPGRPECLSRQLLPPSRLTAGERKRRLAREGEGGVVVEPDASAKLSGSSVRLASAPGVLPSLREAPLDEPPRKAEGVVVDCLRTTAHDRRHLGDGGDVTAGRRGDRP